MGNYYDLSINNHLGDEIVKVNTAKEIKPNERYDHRFTRNANNEITVEIKDGKKDFYWISLPSKGDYHTNNFKMICESDEVIRKMEFKFKDGVHIKIPNSNWKIIFKNPYSIEASTFDMKQTNDNVTIGDKEP